MQKFMMRINAMTLALVFGVVAAAPPALANEACSCWRHHRHVAYHWRHPGFGHPHWVYQGWGPGIGFGARTAVTDDRPPVYNHPYYYGGGPYGNCNGYRPVYDRWGNVSEQSVYIC
jgi:hypothetical protein